MESLERLCWCCCVACEPNKQHNSLKNVMDVTGHVHQNLRERASFQVTQQAGLFSPFGLCECFVVLCPACVCASQDG